VADFHRNIFSYYRGASQPEQDREQQLEDNTTKALVNTLEHCRRHVATKFLEWLGISTPRNISFVQQKGTIGDERIRRKSQRLGHAGHAGQTLFLVSSDGCRALLTKNKV
jgi:hypothetical protein